jgi:hypothetical protein
MLFHLSFTARDTARVADVVAELLGATVVDAPSPPFPERSKLVCCFDDRGTLVEILPSGTAYVPGPDAMPLAVAGEPTQARTAVHGLFATPLTCGQITAIAEREHWPCGLVAAGPFKVIAVWLEGTQLIELTTPSSYPTTSRSTAVPHVTLSIRNCERSRRTCARLRARLDSALHESSATIPRRHRGAEARFLECYARERRHDSREPWLRRFLARPDDVRDPTP